ncbi:molybdopterin-dependent oxidoreductase [Solicola gregarius]|uniref:Molybdopterin-dependent oxidoreductase n=1 Tax=Solicola gregarius TaxID=2908642 RepID=A0AA46YKK0_9ACTN|nr:molybdopterin-dependent oxidoreductase [Solicola gregarius]UYM04556.1 molybdopterin-dependent oxidoreductase [Solicola gregarius]
MERGSIALLVASALFQLVSGTVNISQWYPWGFSFRATHYAVAWVFIGSLAIHIAVKLPVVREAYLGGLTEPDGPGLSRRGLLRTTWVAAGLVVVATAGQSVPLLRKVSVFAVRSGDGPQDVPVNRSATAAGVEYADASTWALDVVYDGATRRFTRDELERLPQATETLPIACVEGWSVSASWEGVPVADLLSAVGAPASSRVYVSSLQTRGAFGSSELPPQFAADRRTLLALRLNGAELDLDHGYPCRIIAPNRPGVMQTKWVSRLEVYA